MSDSSFDNMEQFDDDDALLDMFGEETGDSEDSEAAFGGDFEDGDDTSEDDVDVSDFEEDSEEGSEDDSFGSTDYFGEEAAEGDSSLDDILAGLGDSDNTDEENLDTSEFEDDAGENTVTAEELGFSSMEDGSDIGEVDRSELKSESNYDNSSFGIDNMYVGNTGMGGQPAIYVDSSAFSFELLAIDKIVVPPYRIRQAVAIDRLMLSIKNEGLLNPIVVAPTVTEGVYVVVKGFRRLLACAKVGISTVPCIINNKVMVTELPIVEALYSHSKPYTVTEMLEFIKYLKEQKNIASATYIEHLLNMESGDYSKLMDVVEDDDEDIMTQLIGGQLTIQQAFKKLEQKRKKMSKDERDNVRAQKIYNNASEYGADRVAGSGETSDDVDNSLSPDELKSIVESLENTEALDSEDGEALKQAGDSIQGFKPHKQDPNDRERLDPKLRKSVLARDNNTCRICEQISGQEYTEVLDVHHIQEVYLGGSDDINNLITACTCCHKLVHLWGRGELFVRPFKDMDENEARKFKRIIKLGNTIRQGMAAKGMTKKELKEKDNADTIGRRLKGSSDQVAG